MFLNFHVLNVTNQAKVSEVNKKRWNKSLSRLWEKQSVREVLESEYSHEIACSKTLQRAEKKPERRRKKELPFLAAERREKLACKFQF